MEKKVLKEKKSTWRILKIVSEWGKPKYNTKPIYKNNSLK